MSQRRRRFGFFAGSLRRRAEGAQGKGREMRPTRLTLTSHPASQLCPVRRGTSFLRRPGRPQAALLLNGWEHTAAGDCPQCRAEIRVISPYYVSTTS